MTTKMSAPLLVFCLWAAVMAALIMGKRLKTAIKKLEIVNKEITSLIYVAAFIPLLLVAQLIPMSLLVFLLVWIVVAFPFSYHFNRKYSIWLAAKLKDKKRQENLEKLMEMQMQKEQRR